MVLLLFVHKCQTALTKKGFVYLGTHQWSTINCDFQTIQEAKKFVKKYELLYLQSIFDTYKDVDRSNSTVIIHRGHLSR